MVGEGSIRVAWSGTVVAVQPRIALLRSFDQRTHSYLGYVLRVQGRVGETSREFVVAIGHKTHERLHFTPGGQAEGDAEWCPDPERTGVHLHKAARLSFFAGAQPSQEPPPWTGPPPALSVYRARGHRRLAAQRYASHCWRCQWGARMPVSIIIDQWQPHIRRHRIETFCYGPLSCPWYRPGPVRTVPGRKGMIWTEEDWVDAEATAHRGPDE